LTGKSPVGRLAQEAISMANLQVEESMVALARERRTWREICALYPDEWVTLIDLEWEDGDEDNGEVSSAVVLAHSPQRGEGLRNTSALREREGIMECAHLAWIAARRTMA
jgi:hypothetical protein